MRLKYYLRGAGIGVIVAVLIMMLAFHIHGSEMTDAQVMQRAEELGMQMPENGTLVDKKTEGEGSDATGSEAAQSSGDSQKTNAADTDQAAADQTAVDQNMDTTDTDGTANSDDQAATPEMISVTITDGEYSDKIAENLQSVHLIQDADAFNQYLIQSGYDNLLLPGTYSIPMGASQEEIAHILCEKTE